jgi:hypothetical protein
VTGRQRFTVRGTCTLPSPTSRWTGSPATVIAWGAWAQIGRATALAEGAGIASAGHHSLYIASVRDGAAHLDG